MYLKGGKRPLQNVSDLGSLTCMPGESEEQSSAPIPASTQANIMSALEREDDQIDLIGDFSRPHCLPTITSKHQDLKGISPHTLSSVLKGDFDDVVEKVVVVDCRYPYEYHNGHIQSALNLYTREQIKQEFVESNQHRSSPLADKRTIIVFHCEFSSERGPRMLRFLRDQDRAANQELYPSLFYPELYILL